MEAAAVTIQQVNAQATAALSILKQNAKAEQAAAQALTQSAAPSGGRGKNLDITV
jgi:hypothetical protein